MSTHVFQSPIRIPSLSPDSTSMRPLLPSHFLTSLSAQVSLQILKNLSNIQYAMEFERMHVVRLFPVPQLQLARFNNLIFSPPTRTEVAPLLMACRETQLANKSNKQGKPAATKMQVNILHYMSLKSNTSL